MGGCWWMVLAGMGCGWGGCWWWWGGGGAGVGVVLAGGPGVPVGRVGVACVRHAALAALDWLWCQGVVGGGRMSVRVGLWSVCNGWLLVDGARWYEVWVGGLLVVVGRSY